jgi:hypothetical protein
MTKDDGRAQQRLGQCIAQGLVGRLGTADAVLLGKISDTDGDVGHSHHDTIV